jgi:hypothetical protein
MSHSGTHHVPFWDIAVPSLLLARRSSSHTKPLKDSDFFTVGRAAAASRSGPVRELASDHLVQKPMGGDGPTRKPPVLTAASHKGFSF